MTKSKPLIPMPISISAAGALAVAFTILLDGEPTKLSLNDATHLLYVFSAVLLALGGTAFFFSAMLIQAEGDPATAEHLGPERISTMKRMNGLIHRAFPWLFVWIGAMLCYRLSPAASSIFMFVIILAVIVFGVMSGRLTAEKPKVSGQ